MNCKILYIVHKYKVFNMDINNMNIITNLDFIYLQFIKNSKNVLMSRIISLAVFLIY